MGNEAEALHRAALRSRLAQLGAREIALILGNYIGIDPELIAARIAEIPREDWTAVAAVEQAA